jgi:hypothetical protein
LHPEVPAYVTQKSSTTRYVQARAPSLATCSLHPIPHKRHLQCPTSQTPITVPNTLSASEHTPSAPGSSPPDAPSRQPHPPSRPLLLPHIYKTRRFPPVASPCTQSPTAATVAHIQTPPAYHRSRQPLIVSLPLVLPHRHKTRPTHPLASPRTQSRTGAKKTDIQTPNREQATRFASVERNRRPHTGHRPSRPDGCSPVAVDVSRRIRPGFIRFIQGLFQNVEICLRLECSTTRGHVIDSGRNHLAGNPDTLPAARLWAPPVRCTADSESRCQARFRREHAGCGPLLSSPNIDFP